MMPASRKLRMASAACSIVHPFVHELQQPVGGLSPAPRRRQCSRPPPSVGLDRPVKWLSNRILVHQLTFSFRRKISSEISFSNLGGAALVDEVETATAGLGHDLFHPVDESGGRNAFITADVVERGVAEGTAGPIASVSDYHLVPTAVAPETVHGIGNFAQRKIARYGAAR